MAIVNAEDQAAARARRDEIATAEWDQYAPLDPPREGTCDGCAEGKSLTWQWVPTEAWICGDCHDGNPVGELIGITRALDAALSSVEQERDALKAENAAMRDAMRSVMNRTICGCRTITTPPDASCLYHRLAVVVSVEEGTGHE